MFADCSFTAEPRPVREAEAEHEVSVQTGIWLSVGRSEMRVHEQGSQVACKRDVAQSYRWRARMAGWILMVTKSKTHDLQTLLLPAGGR